MSHCGDRVVCRDIMEAWKARAEKAEAALAKHRIRQCDICGEYEEPSRGDEYRGIQGHHFGQSPLTGKKGHARCIIPTTRPGGE